MIARGDAIGSAAIGDCGRRVLPGAWQGPVLPMPGPAAQRQPRRIAARR